MTSCISPLPHTIETNPRIKWSASQENSINREFPFADLHNETPEQFVVRTYLQFVWLPESLMPLDRLVASLRRVQIASTSTTDCSSSPHPLHALLDPILLTPRTAANKYQLELPRILDDNGGAGEIEETMMWFALSFEKANENQHERTRTNTGSSVSTVQSSDSTLWSDEKWRARWIRRMERREVQIQILLHLLILSLPGPPPPPPQPESPELSSVKRRKRPRKKAARIPTPEDRLEAFMDKLSMWQLMGDLDMDERVRATSKANNELDWIQLFCQDIVEPLFKSVLPTLCTLLRSKVFPHSPFSDDEDDHESQESGSPPPRPLKRTRQTTSDRGSVIPTRYPSPALSTTSNSSTREQKRNTSHRDSHPSLQRERSRSLSVSLAEEAEEKQKAKNAVRGTSKARVLSREVSMTFKTKSKTMDRANSVTAAPSFLVSDSRAKRELEPKVIKRELSRSDGETILVEATPLKPVRAVTMSQSKGPLLSSTLFSRTSSKLSAVDEEIWDLPGSSSPDILSLTPTAGNGSTGSSRGAGATDEDEEEDWVVSTPTKTSKKRKVVRSLSP
ncbi:hypothetical protein F5878DRAFT_523485 [Lentinula raphanica]|uniref:DNA replication regulator Sld3 C-terminal domain-containing protein n=1 Tax=Lentinula raphanica TaxID=153919 RepID=A0AA38PN22_9AGAR|nr:hypothetical protein F5880DRAFT_1468678 [Lentinula raphanica]KAJ3845511.1 hypothetical protein F5878DRAFT_523485 [Lentinula raphanica]